MQKKWDKAEQLLQCENTHRDKKLENTLFVAMGSFLLRALLLSELQLYHLVSFCRQPSRNSSPYNRVMQASSLSESASSSEENAEGWFTCCLQEIKK